MMLYIYLCWYWRAWEKCLERGLGSSKQALNEVLAKLLIPFTLGFMFWSKKDNQMTSRYDGILIDCVLYFKCFNAPRKEKKFTKEELRVAKLCSFKLLHGITICVSQLFGNPQNQRCDSDSYCCRPYHRLASDIGYSQSSLAKTSECCLLL